MAVQVVRFLTVVEVDGTIEKAEDLFREFQALVKNFCARSVWRATLEDLDDFAPEVIRLPEDRIDAAVSPMPALAEPHYEN